MRVRDLLCYDPISGLQLSEIQISPLSLEGLFRQEMELSSERLRWRLLSKATKEILIQIFGLWLLFSNLYNDEVILYNFLLYVIQTRDSSSRTSPLNSVLPVFFPVFSLHAKIQANRLNS
jgi:hypothetical protein